MSYSNLSTASAKVFLSYAEVPPHPGKQWTRFVCISDSHSRVYSVPPGDVLLHAGDLTQSGYPNELASTIDWLKSLPHPTKIIIAGNHDLCLDENWPEAHKAVWPEEVSEKERQEKRHELVRSRACLEANIHYLQYEPFEFTTLGGRRWKVYGSPATTFYDVYAFQYSDHAQAEAIYQKIPLDTEILLTHSPPFQVLDKTPKGEYAGCTTLLRRLQDLRACKLHLFGHIHDGHGAELASEGSRVAVNGALPSGKQAIIVDLKN